MHRVIEEKLAVFYQKIQLETKVFSQSKSSGFPQRKTEKINND
jgi:hypothetical protein